MALLSINQIAPQQPRESTLDKIMKGVQIANGLLGTALEIPKYQTAKKAAENAGVEQTVNILSNTQPTPQGGTPDISYMGKGRTVIPNFAKVIEGEKVSDLQPGSTNPKLIDDVYNALPPDIQRSTNKEALGRMSIGDLTTIQKTRLTKEPQADIRAAMFLSGVMNQGGQPYAEGQMIPADYRMVDFTPYLGPSSQGAPTKFIVPNKVSEDTHKRAESLSQKDEDENRKAIDKASGMVRANSPLRTAINRTRQADNALNLIDAAKKGEIVINEQTAYELALAIASGISSGNQPAYELVKHLVPSGTQPTAANISQYITNKPQQFLSDPLLDQYTHTLNREKAYWGSIGQKDINSIKSGMRPVWKRRPDLSEDFDRAMSREAAGPETISDEEAKKF